MQIKIIQDLDNNINKKRNLDLLDGHVQYIKIDQDHNNEQHDKKSDLISYNDDNAGSVDHMYGSTSFSSYYYCKHLIKNRILASHQNDIDAARNYMHTKKLNNKRGAIPKWVKNALF